ncbi:MAG: 16S rRNA (guanine(966)-N(2))-methyltransferase RsmD [Chromatocurvus sp.]
MTAGRRQRAPQTRTGGTVRIIGGRWRGRRLPVADARGLRPTADRVRETLFNWLQADISGAHCLDLFAGSGALGIEALSRGADHCTFVDSNAGLLRGIGSALATLGGSGQAECHAQSAEKFLARCQTGFDLVFLDPPFADDLLSATCQQLQDSTALVEQSLIYIESSHALAMQALPARWQALRQKSTGAVHYALYHSGRQDQHGQQDRIVRG